MDEQQIIEWAWECGARKPTSLYGRTDYLVMTSHELKRFAALVAVHERERCAKICDESSIPNPQEIHTITQWVAKRLAMSIRALKD